MGPDVRWADCCSSGDCRTAEQVKGEFQPYFFSLDAVKLTKNIQCGKHGNSSCIAASRLHL